MSNKSRRRVTTAAVAILAGAAIPIAAAATAWADTTETQQQLQDQGLSSDQAQAVVTAENNGTPVEVTYDGKIVVEANQGGTATTDATATSGRNDVAAAIGDGSTSSSHRAGAVSFSDGTTDDAVARGKDASASVTDDSTSTGATGGNTATAKGEHADAYAYGDSGGKETAKGFGTSVDAENTTDSTVSASGKDTEAYTNGGVSGSTVTASGKEADAVAENTVSDSTITAHGKHAYADASGDDSNVKVTATGKATDAYAFDSSDGSAIAKHTHLGGPTPPVAVRAPEGSDAIMARNPGFSGYAEINYTSDSSALAKGGGSIAEVDGSASYPGGITDSSAKDTNGTTTYVDTSDTHEVNGSLAAVGAAAEVTAPMVHVPLLP